jgi:hypothetical protein
MSSSDDGETALRSAEVRWLHAALTGDDRERERIARGELAGGLPFEVSVAACTLLAGRLFDERWDRRLISTFAERVVATMPAASALLPRHIEASLRGMTGEAELLTPANYEGGPGIVLAPLFALADELALDDGAVGALLVEAEREAAKAALLTMPQEPGDDPVPAGDQWRRINRRYLTDNDFPVREHAVARQPRRFPADRYPVRRWRRKPEPASVAGRYLRNLVLRQHDREPRVSEVSDVDVFKMTRAAFTIAVKMYLHPDPELVETMALASAARATFWADLDLLKTEYLTRWILGEKMTFTGITRRDVYASCSLQLAAIIDAWDNDDVAVCAILVEAERDVAASGHVLEN